MLNLILKWFSVGQRLLIVSKPLRRGEVTNFSNFSAQTYSKLHVMCKPEQIYVCFEEYVSTLIVTLHCYKKVWNF